jgi:hypothetical protein
VSKHEQALVGAARTYAAAGEELDGWVDVVVVSRRMCGDRQKAALIVLDIMIERGAVGRSDRQAGLLLNALDRLADLKEAEGHVPA